MGFEHPIIHKHVQLPHFDCPLQPRGARALGRANSKQGQEETLRHAHTDSRLKYGNVAGGRLLLFGAVAQLGQNDVDFDYSSDGHGGVGPPQPRCMGVGLCPLQEEGPKLVMVGGPLGASTQPPKPRTLPHPDRLRLLLPLLSTTCPLRWYNESCLLRPPFATHKIVLSYSKGTSQQVPRSMPKGLATQCPYVPKVQTHKPC